MFDVRLFQKLRRTHPNVRPCETLARVFTFSGSVTTTTTTSRVLNGRDSEWLVQRADIKSINLEALYCTSGVFVSFLQSSVYIRKMLMAYLEDSVSDVR